MKLLVAYYALLAVGFSAAQLTRPHFSKLRAGGAHDADAADVPSSSASMKRIKSYGSDIAGSKPKPEPDTGILPRKQGTPSRRLAATCPGESVVCDDGDAGGVTCEAACEEKCCVGTSACDGFTGKVCKDNMSCFGDSACEDANIGLIVQGCNGTEACYNAGYDGFIGEVYNGCLGEGSCRYAAEDGGTIGVIQDSCLGYEACSSAGDAGTIGNISSSCHGNYACSFAAAYGGSVGDILYSCLQESSCESAAACNKTDLLCGSKITLIDDSCDGEQACYYAAYGGGYIGGIQNACNALKACFYAAEASTISSGINNCCNAELACNEITILPDECKKPPTSAPTAAPSKSSTTAPTAAPSKPPTNAPTAAPSISPTSAPTASLIPTAAPTTSPTAGPTAPFAASTADPTHATKSGKKNKRSKKGMANESGHVVSHVLNEPVEHQTTPHQVPIFNRQ